jgi:hypothetical protein
VCTFAEFKMFHSPISAGEISRFFANFTRNAWRYGHMDLMVEFSMEFLSIAEGLGGFPNRVLHLWCLDGSVTPHLKLAKF